MKNPFFPVLTGGSIPYLSFVLIEDEWLIIEHKDVFHSYGKLSGAVQIM